jgi:transposase InsO family protein
MDFVGPLPMTSGGHDFLLVVVDKFSKTVHLVACGQMVTAAEVAQLVYDNVVRLHGFPENIVSDRDSRFTSKFWQALWKLSGTKLMMSSSYHPQTDGQTENVNRAVQDILRAYVKDNRKDWDRHLTAVEIAINSSRHASTGYTPHFLSHNQEMRLPFGIALKETMADVRVPAAVSAMTEMAANDEAARARMAEAQAQQVKAANRHRREESYAVGEQVMLNTKHLTGYKRKLACRYIGPFAVVAIGTGNVTLDLPADMSIHDVVNVDRVKRYVPSVGEWPGRLQHSRPLPVKGGDDGTGEYEVEAILGKMEELESSSDTPAVGDKRRKKVMVTRYLVLWKGYSMEDCSWERDANLAGAMDLVMDYERRLQADETGHPSVMVLCLGES